MKMLQITWREFKGMNYRWQVEPNGPFPMTIEEFRKVQDIVREEYKDSGVLDSGWNTRTRQLLGEHTKLKDFDKLVVCHHIMLEVADIGKVKLEMVEY